MRLKRWPESSSTHLKCDRNARDSLVFPLKRPLMLSRPPAQWLAPTFSTSLPKDGRGHLPTASHETRAHLSSRGVILPGPWITLPFSPAGTAPSPTTPQAAPSKVSHLEPPSWSSRGALASRNPRSKRCHCRPQNILARQPKAHPTQHHVIPQWLPKRRRDTHTTSWGGGGESRRQSPRARRKEPVCDGAHGGSCGWPWRGTRSAVPSWARLALDWMNEGGRRDSLPSGPSQSRLLLPPRKKNCWWPLRAAAACPSLDQRGARLLPSFPPHTLSRQGDVQSDGSLASSLAKTKSRRVAP